MWSIIKSHFHKGKIGFIITGLFVILSVLMMIVGLSICFGMENLYINARNLSNSPDMSIYVYEKKGGALSTRIIDSVLQRDDIDLLDSQTFYYLEMPKDDENYVCDFIFNEYSDMAFKGFGVYNIEDKNNKFKPYVRDEVAGEGYKFYVSGNYLISGHLGDKVIFKFNGETYLGYVAGVFDDMCKIYSTNYFYVDNAFFDLVAEYGKKDTKGIVLEENTINIRTKHVDEKASVQAVDSIGKSVLEIARQFNMEQYPITQKLIECGYTDRQTFKDGTSPFILILGAALTAFAVIVAVIVAIVIGFLVRSSVMDEVRNLGILKSLGYTTNMLRLSYLAIYAIISIACMIIGIALGIGLMPNFVHIITNMARLDCSKAIGLNVGSVFIAISMLAIVIAGVVMLATNRVKRVTTLSAMRNNLETHTFKRNHIPLEKSKMPVNVSLGSKSVVGEVNRSVMVVVVVLIMSLLCSFISVVYYNLKVDQTALIEMSAMENPDYIIGLRYEDNKPYFDALRAMDSYEYDMLAVAMGCYIDDVWQQGTFYENFEILRTKVVYKGRYPKYTNEILINEKYAKQKGYEIGDTITVKLEYTNNNTYEKDCVIVGCFQSLFENCDFMAFYSLFEADINEDTNFWQRYFYFKKGQTPTYGEIKNVLRSVNNESLIQFGGFMSGMDRLKNSILTTVETAADAVMSVFMSVTAIIISLLLVMLIKLKLLRERRNYAVYKALGYTTKDIMAQIAIAMVVLGVVGSIVGSIIGALITSPMLSLMGSMIGAGHFAFIIPWGYVVGIIFCVPLLIYLVSMLCSVPVKNIAPASLLRERG